MLVNIQDQTEFSCQVLNRDLWSDKIVKEIIRESFVFLQVREGLGIWKSCLFLTTFKYDCESPEGKRYLTLYPIGNYPHIAIIDSRTGIDGLKITANMFLTVFTVPKGERVKTWEKVLSPTDFVMDSKFGLHLGSLVPNLC